MPADKSQDWREDMSTAPPVTIAGPWTFLDGAVIPSGYSSTDPVATQGWVDAQGYLTSAPDLSTYMRKTGGTFTGEVYFYEPLYIPEPPTTVVEDHQYRYQDKVNKAIEWLGERYIGAQPAQRIPSKPW